MKMKTLQKIITLAVLLLATPAALPAADVPKPPAKPNILIILVDDMGFSDLGCYGSEIKTPNIDRLAANGMKFADMYVRLNPSVTVDLKYHEQDIPLLEVLGLKNEYD